MPFNYFIMYNEGTNGGLLSLLHKTWQKMYIFIGAQISGWKTKKNKMIMVIYVL